MPHMSDMEDETMKFVPKQTVTTGQPTVLYPTVAGVQTEVVDWPAKDPLQYSVLIVPGNPGCAHFYLEFAQALRTELGTAAAINIVSHLGHQVNNNHSGRVFSLQEQIAHKTEFVRGLGAAAPVFIVGHSIGAHMGLEIMRALPSQVHGVVGLFPFLQVDWNSRKQIAIWSMVTTRLVVYTVMALARLLAQLPVVAQRVFFHVMATRSFSPASAEVTRRCLTQATVIDNATFMARTEFEVLDRAPDWGFLQHAADRVRFIFTKDDHWGPMWMYDKVRQRIPGLRNEICDDVNHGFCCSSAYSVKVAKHAATMLNDLVARLDGSPK